MKTGRRGFFGLLTGVLAAPVLAKHLPEAPAAVQTVAPVIAAPRIDPEPHISTSSVWCGFPRGSLFHDEYWKSRLTATRNIERQQRLNRGGPQ